MNGFNSQAYNITEWDRFQKLMKKHVSFKVLMDVSNCSKHYYPLGNFKYVCRGGILRSRLAYMHYHGRPIRKGNVIHHSNLDSTDDSKANLVEMTKAEHVRLHKRLSKVKRDREYFQYTASGIMHKCPGLDDDAQHFAAVRWYDEGRNIAQTYCNYHQNILNKGYRARVQPACVPASGQYKLAA